MTARCRSISPRGETLRGRPVRCEGRMIAGQCERVTALGAHGHSFAARYWQVGAYSCPLCGFESLTAETNRCRFERGCSCWRGIPCTKPTMIGEGGLR